MYLPIYNIQFTVRYNFCVGKITLFLKNTIALISLIALIINSLCKTKGLSNKHNSNG